MAATAFLGYVLPWGSMSFCRRDRHHQPVSAIPLVGTSIAIGCGAVTRSAIRRSTASSRCTTCCRSSSSARWVCTSGRSMSRARTIPDGVEAKNVDRDTVAFTPYATIKDVFAVSALAHRLCLADLLHPELSRPTPTTQISPIPGDAGARRPGMVPAAVLRHPARDPEQAARASSRSSRRSRPRVPAVARPLACQIRQIPADLSFLLLGLCRDLHWARLAWFAGADGGADVIARFLTVGYFGFFLVVMPILSFTEKTKPIPASIADAVLARKPVAAAAPA